MDAQLETKEENRLRYEYIAHQINREDGLVNYRLTWSLTLNGFLFAALGFLGAKDVADESIRSFFHWALPLTGIIVSMAGLLGVLAAHFQILYLTREWERLNDPRWPRPFGSKDSWLGSFVIGTLPGLAPPVILTVVWFGLFFSWR